MIKSSTPRVDDSIQTWRRSQLTQQHLDFMVAPGTLRIWSGMTMKERQVMFHRQYPVTKISMYHLRLVYKQAGVKNKMIRMKKQVPTYLGDKINKEANEAYSALKAAKNDGSRIVYIDELCTTKSTILRHDWSEIGYYPVTEPKQFHRSTIATVAAMSFEKGVELVMNFEKSVDQEKFIKFMKRLKQQDPFA